MINPIDKDIGRKVVWVGMPGRAPGKYVVGTLLEFFPDREIARVRYDGNGTTSRVNHSYSDLNFFTDLPNPEAEAMMGGVDDLPKEIRELVYEMGGVILHLYHNFRVHDPAKLREQGRAMLEARAKQEAPSQAAEDDRRRRAREAGIGRS